MFDFILRRLLMTIPVMLFVTFFIFSLLYLTPGDPAALIAGDQASEADILRIRESLGLVQPYLIRFFEWLMNVIRGNLGISIFSQLPVTTLIAQRLEPTLALTAMTMIISVLVAVPMGVLAAARQGSVIDRLVVVVAVFGFSVPVFAIGYLLSWIFALQMGLLPIQGYTPEAVVKIGDTPADVAEGLNAGAWVIGIAATGNETGLSRQALEALPEAEREAVIERARDRLRRASAHYVVDSIAEVPEIANDIRGRLEAGYRP